VVMTKQKTEKIHEKKLLKIDPWSSVKTVVLN
jgi:hypothetical protein